MKETLHILLMVMALITIILVALHFLFKVVPLPGDEKDTESTANTVTPVAETSDTIIPNYVKAVHEQSAACDALVITAHRMEATAEECMETLKQCTDMLKSNHLIPKRTAEKEKP